ncbi:MAG TPA: NAD-glutamate dehydrogenase [Acidimicrobiia bacterium]|nr:NAD-glutamate dehydrogenase [Acidimicrobiia bacterium]
MPGVDVPEALVEGYFAAADAADLTVLGARDRAGAVRAHLALAAARAPGTAAVRVGNPTVERDGWETPHTVIEVVSDDMPFVVDSLTALVARAGYDVHLLVHPVVEGASFVHVEIDRESDPAILGALAASVESVLADVRAAVDDWVPMRARVLARAQDLRAAPPTGVPAGDADEAAAFLERLADNHFTFVGAADDTGGNALGVARRRLPEGLPDLDRAPTPVLTLTKTLERSTVHRAVPFDLVGVKQFDSRGRVIGEERFFGLHTADTYSEPITELPVLRRKADAVMARAGFAAAGHDSRTLANVLATLPRDEMLRGSADRLYELAMGVARLGERRRLRLFVSHDPSHRFVSCLVYVPRDRYTTSVRSAVLDALRDAYRGGDVDFTALVTESVLARLHVVVQRPQRVDVDEVAVESELARIARAWTDDFRDALVSARGEEAGLDAFRAWGDAFPSAYQSDVTAVEAVRDLSVLEAGDDLAIRLVGARPDAIAHLALYRVGAPLVLSDVMRVLEHLDVTVVDEHPYEITPSGLPPRWIYSFGVRATHRAVLADPGAQSRVAELFLGVWAGTIENDSLNRLVLRAGLTARDVVVLRALVKYLHQCGVRFTEGSVADALAANPRTTALVVELFATRFDPVLGDEDRSSRGAALEAQLAHEIDRVASLDEDRILRTLVALVQAAVRTNAFVSTATEYLAIKLDPTKLPFLPAPRPRHEIWVYSPTIEAVHVRGGDVARGGIRWSERRDDFRTEILGLMKAQTEKNAVIVPVGAKGGFVVKRPPADSEALRREVLACYRSFIAALLDVTDNLVDGSVVAPRGIVRHDGDDPYLVVAADKGTASFSDEANRLAVDRSYWLGDAFASGGSSGYDHKAMGITSRGAWVSVRAHFRAMGVDADAAELTTVGIGDMSGDVFGNGMLRSRHLKLLAAFDHRHVFLDPDPDPAVSYEERRRLFALPASSWADYDAALVSAGGGVYARENKALPVSPEVRAALGIEGDIGTLTPDEMVSAILRAPVDLLWNGGIGTFVKASDETDADVGDRATDAVRVDADELRCRVVAEGGNLGLTQRARVEYALAGGRVNTDAIDNSAGVDCSDHEVNIKILLGRAIGARVLAAVDRDPLLASMTDEVAALVLADNEAQTNALEIASVEAPDFVGVHARQIERLEHAGILDRELERLPDAKALQERHVNDRGLTSPELAVLLAFTKLELQRALVESDVPDDSFFRRDLVDYFPTPLRERYADAIDAHPLRREITATVIANAVVNRAGISFLSRLSDEIGVGLPALARAHVIARDLFDVVEVWSAIDGLDLVVPSATQDRMFLAARRLVERAARWLAREGREHDAGGAIARFRGPVHAILGRLPELVVGTGAEQLSATAAQLRAGGVPPDLASRVAGFEAAVAALPIADVASGLATPVLDVAAVHFLLAARLRLDWLRDRIAELPRADRWQTEARAALRDDLTDIHQELTRAVVATTDRADPVATRVEQWVAAHDEAVARALGVLADVEAGGVFDLATLGAARRELRELVT